MSIASLPIGKSIYFSEITSNASLIALLASSATWTLYQGGVAAPVLTGNLYNKNNDLGVYEGFVTPVASLPQNPPATNFVGVLGAYYYIVVTYNVLALLGAKKVAIRFRLVPAEDVAGVPLTQASGGTIQKVTESVKSVTDAVTVGAFKNGVVTPDSDADTKILALLKLLNERIPLHPCSQEDLREMTAAIVPLFVTLGAGLGPVLAQALNPPIGMTQEPLQPFDLILSPSTWTVDVHWDHAAHKRTVNCKRRGGANNDLSVVTQFDTDGKTPIASTVKIETASN